MTPNFIFGTLEPRTKIKYRVYVLAKNICVRPLSFEKHHFDRFSSTEELRFNLTILRLKVIFKAFMMAFSVINLILWVNVKVKKLLVSFGNFAQVILVIFVTLGKLTLSAIVTLMIEQFTVLIYTNFRQIMHFFV